MKNDRLLQRRDAIAGLFGLSALYASSARAQPRRVETPRAAPHTAHAPKDAGIKDAPPAAPLSPQLKAVLDTTADCQRAGRYCLARCTDHLAAGTPLMEHCQRAVMNMLAVVGAMADTAGYANANASDLKLLAKACASFCRSCAKACEPHAAHHEECKACLDACLACAKACDAL